MGFLSALSLLWLVPVAGLIVAAYILKLRRRDVVVSSTYLWRQVIRDVQANAPFQKLRRNLLLILQLIAAALLVLALSRPFWRQAGLGGRSMVLIVDCSASMGATDVRPDRLSEAKQQALAIVGGMRPGDQMLVVAAAGRPDSVTPFTADRNELRQAISALRVCETGTNMRDALALASALVSSREASRIDVLSDGGFAPVTGVDFGETHVAFHPVGVRAENVGITAADYRRIGGTDPRVEVLVTVRNYGRAPRTFTLELVRGKDTVDAREVRLAAGVESAEVFDLPEQPDELDLRAHADVRDDLAADDEAFLAIAPRKPIRTLLVSGGNPFLEKALQADPGVELYRVAASAFKSPAGYDAVILDGESPATLPEGNYLFVDCASDRAPVTPGVTSQGGSIIDTNRAHAAMRYVDFGRVRWTAIRAGKSAPWAQEVASSEGGPAVVAGEQGAHRVVWTGFRLDAAHGAFPVTVAYPVFVSSVVRWLARADDAGSSQARTGQAVPLDAPAGVRRLQVRKPDGVRRDVTVASRGQTFFDETDSAGFYTVTAPSYRRVLAANLADAVESDIAPRRSPDLGANPPGEGGRHVLVTRQMWPVIAGLLLVVLVFEWWAFHRRVFVS